MTDVPGLHGLDLSDCPFALIEQQPRVAQQDLAVDRGCHAARPAREQLHAQIILEMVDALRQCRLREVDVIGSAPHVAVLHHCHELPKLSHVHSRNLSPRGI